MYAMPLKVAAVQYPLAEGLKVDTFYAKIGAYLAEAAQAGAELVVFPELITLELVDWQSPISDVDQLIAIAKDFTPAYFEWLTVQAKSLNIAILGGTSPRAVGDAILNTSPLAFADGTLIMQDKLFLTPDEKAWGWTGGDTLRVFEAAWGKTVIAICFDCEFPLVSGLLASERPDMILVPSWTSTHSGLNRVDFTARARAVEHFAYVVKTGTVPDLKSTLPHYGQASLHTPQESGFPVKPNEGYLNEPGLVYGELDLEYLREKKLTSGYYPSHEQSLRAKPVLLARG